MKLKSVKAILDKLTPEQLEQPFLYKSDDLSVSGTVKKISKAKSDLYVTGEDDPAQLYTKKQLKDQGLDNEEISECQIEIPKGSIVVEF